MVTQKSTGPRGHIRLRRTHHQLPEVVAQGKPQLPGSRRDTEFDSIREQELQQKYGVATVVGD